MEHWYSLQRALLGLSITFGVEDYYLLHSKVP